MAAGTADPAEKDAVGNIGDAVKPSTSGQTLPEPLGKKKSTLEWTLKWLAALLCYSPMIAFLAIPHKLHSIGLAVAALLSITFHTVTFVQWRLHFSKVWPENLSVGFLIVFLGLWICTWFTPSVFSARWFTSIGNGFIAAWVAGGMLIGRPFVLDFVKEKVPPAFWAAPQVTTMAQVMTSFWLGAFLVMAASALVMSITGGQSHQPIAILVIFSYALPYGALLLAIALTIWYKRRSREHVRAAFGTQASLSIPTPAYQPPSA